MENRIFDMEEVKVSKEDAATKTVFYSSDATSGSVWVIQPGQTLQKHQHTQSDDIWVVLQGEGIYYPEKDKEVPFHKGQVLLAPKGMCHGAKNIGKEDIIFVSIVAPVPLDYQPIEE
ncbi:MAG: cupin domain-containing protein [Solobacterium sp.]|nr:cupin domain-containing protein [Solobacterium sp.]